MKAFRFKKIDAFVQGKASGNPAGCIYLETKDSLQAAGMQQIARELKGFVNEVGFLSPTTGGYWLRYYSSECEVDFCGHATIAIMHDLVRTNAELSNKQEFSIEVGAGKLTVFNQLQTENAVYVMSPLPSFIPCNLTQDAVAQVLAVKQTAIDREMPLAVINAGLRTLIVPIISLDSCLAIYPDQERLRLFCLANDIDIILVFCRETARASYQFRTRVFAAKFGYLEDPATGSGNAAFGHYLIRQGMWREHVTIEQGPVRSEPNTVKLRRYRQAGNEYILFGGSGVTRIEGNYFLQG